jgi:hypothetical protein
MPHPFAVLAVEEVHQQDGDVNFDASHEQHNFDLNLEAVAHQHELQQIISKPQWNIDFFLTISMTTSIN